MRRVFDKAYYDRFYRSPATRVASPAKTGRLGAFVCAYLKYLELEVESVLDLGCGLGQWAEIVKRHFPRATYTGVETSAYLCDEYGWERGSVVDYAAADNADYKADFVICQGVLHYLDARNARRAIRNLARLTRGALYLEVLTKRDWEENCDQTCTDGHGYLRNADWYRRELSKHFTACGGGLFVPLESDVVLYELEKL